MNEFEFWPPPILVTCGFIIVKLLSSTLVISKLFKIPLDIINLEFTIICMQETGCVANSVCRLFCKIICQSREIYKCFEEYTFHLASFVITFFMTKIDGDQEDLVSLLILLQTFEYLRNNLLIICGLNLGAQDCMLRFLYSTYITVTDRPRKTYFSSQQYILVTTTLQSQTFSAPSENLSV